VDAVSLLAFGTEAHYAWYQALIEQEPHRDTDFYSCVELRELIAGHTVEAWVVLHGSVPVGWCAVTLRSPHHPLPEAVHFLGSIVEKRFRGRGVGSAMVVARLALFGRRPITASVIPGNTPSERMLQSKGFQPGLMQGPWRTWHRPGDAHPMVLLDTPERVEMFSQRGVYAELAANPVEGGNGRITRGLWPDPAAFHATSLAADCAGRAPLRGDGSQ
jgi:GNAT superfamily N-acetyltransferase